ncbi:unnamed protein product [Candidula unifasciata]|uniref:Alpha-2-macroglobulin receptor-associated protein n=1 Tax=Candidula unifasciata TaxID=100452 RepID=A0A8S3ZQQ3_9EUPU|nr:unnamed protein product [Candidula unifasciata]
MFKIIICISLVADVCASSKYSKEAQGIDRHDTDLDFQNTENPFRMKKVNLLWTKGRQVLPSVKLAELYADLKVHDKHEAHLKKLRAQDLDQDGDMETKVLTNYRRIVHDYGLDENFSQNDIFISNELPADENVDKKVQFQDSKLQTMWSKAQQAGFSEEDLNLLKEEFMHQQMKINEFDFVHKELNKLADPDDNVIDREQLKMNLSPKKLSDKKDGMKKVKRDIKEGYMKLEHLVSTIPASEPVFKDSRVHKLWALAKKTNWTNEQLNGFKEELLHFEHRLNKQEYYQKQLQQSAEALQDVDVPENHKNLEEKTQNLNRKIKKLHTEFQTRLNQALKHSEL